MPINTLPPWSQAGWLEEVTNWVQVVLARQGIRVIGVIEQVYARPWAVVLRVPASTGDTYFKAMTSWKQYEVAVSSALYCSNPDHVLSVLGADIERGWLLMPDGGERLRERIRSSRDFRHWEGVLPSYAELQKDLVEQVPDMLAMGVPDRRLAVLPGLYEQLIAHREALHLDQQDSLTSENFERLKTMIPRVAYLCETLAAFPIPETLNHDDLTDGNVFLLNERPQFFDWGDCVISHPFFSLRTAFVSLYFSLGMDEGAPELDLLRDVYLRSWTKYASFETLLAAYHLSRPLAAINRAFSWRQDISQLDPADQQEFALHVPSLLQEFLELEKMVG